MKKKNLTAELLRTIHPAQKVEFVLLDGKRITGYIRGFFYEDDEQANPIALSIVKDADDPLAQLAHRVPLKKIASCTPVHD